MTSQWFNLYSRTISFAYKSRQEADARAMHDRLYVVRMDTYNGVSTLHLESLE